MKVGDNIHALRKLRGITQQELAEKLYVSRQSISLWETGQTVPTVDNLVAMCKIFDVTMDELCGETINGFSQPKAADADADLIASFTTVLDEPAVKAVVDWTYKKSILANILAILAGIALIIALILNNCAIYAIIPGSIVAVFISIFIRTLCAKKKTYNVMLTGESKKTIEFRFFCGHVEFVTKTNNSVNKYNKKYEEITVIEKPDYLFMKMYGNVAVIDKVSAGENLQAITKLLKGGVKKYSSHKEVICNTKIKPSNRQKKVMKPLLMALFVLTLVCVIIAFIIVVILFESGEYSFAPELMLKYMWIFLLFLPVPLTSVFLGIYWRIRGIRCLKNIVAGAVTAVILFGYGMFIFIPNNYSYDYAYVNEISYEIGFELPKTGKVSTQSFDSSQDSGKDILVRCVSDVIFTDESETAIFEFNAEQSPVWLDTIDKGIIKRVIGDDYYTATVAYDYFMMYDRGAKEFNSPINAPCEILYLAYKCDINYMKIIESRVTE